MYSKHIEKLESLENILKVSMATIITLKELMTFHDRNEYETDKRVTIAATEKVIKGLGGELELSGVSISAHIKGILILDGMHS